MDLLSRFFKSKTKKPGSLSSGGTYDVTTKTYTDPMGNKMSTDIKSAQKAGAVMTFGGGGGRSYVGGGTYDVTTHTYTDLFGNKMSMDIESAQKAGATFISSLESQLRSKAEAEAEAKAKAEAEAKRLEQQRIEQQTQAEQQRIERLQMAYAKQRFGEVSPIRREGTLVGFLTPEGRVNLSQTSKQFMAGQVTTKELPPKRKRDAFGFVKPKSSLGFPIREVKDTGGAIFKVEEVSKPIKREGKIVGYDTGFMSISRKDASQVALVLGSSKVQPSSFMGSIGKFIFSPPKKSFVVSKNISNSPEAILENVKFITTKPFTIVSEQFGVASGEIKKTKFKGSQVLGDVVGAGSFLVPKTPGGVALTFGGLKLLSVSPTFVRIGAGATFSYLGGKTALNPSLPHSQRIAGGIIGTLGFSGATMESLPFIRGVKVQTLGRLKGEFRPTRLQAEGFRAVKGISIKDFKFDIGLIEAGSPNKFVSGVPKSSPLRRGG